MKDDGEAARVEAAFSNPNAFFKLGIAHACGRNADVDLIAAHKWFNIAATLGHGEARQKRADLARELSAMQIAEAQRHARDWFASRHIAVPARNVTVPDSVNLTPPAVLTPKAEIIILAPRIAAKPKAGPKPKVAAKSRSRKAVKTVG